jgi:hypothetical protein
MNLNDIFYGDILGLILALPVGLFLAFWLSTVKRRAAVVIGALIGALIPFLVILFWIGGLFVPQRVPHVDGGAAFFGSLFLCTITAVIGGILTDIIVANINTSNDRHQVAHS